METDFLWTQEAQMDRTITIPDVLSSIKTISSREILLRPKIYLSCHIKHKTQYDVANKIL